MRTETRYYNKHYSIMMMVLFVLVAPVFGRFEFIEKAQKEKKG